MSSTCTLSGQTFDVSDTEKALRQKLGLSGPPLLSPPLRFRQLGAFWPHWNLHKRTCDKTGKPIISVFSDKCVYPVWDKDHWLNHASPPGANIRFDQNIFPQIWEVFHQSPIPHNTTVGNENCDYTDDYFYSRNCYLCHSGIESEDLKYCYRCHYSKDSRFCAFSYNCELCTDVVNCKQCFNTIYALNCRNCMDSAFLYDCRNCQNCLFCFNLRNKQYCIGNQQLTKEAFEAEKKKWDIRSRAIYLQAKEHFRSMMKKMAYHRAVFVDKCQESSGDFLESSKNSKHCFFGERAEDCVNTVRFDKLKDNLDCVGQYDVEICHQSVMIQDNCYDIRFCFNTMQSKFLEYCAFMFKSEHCFGCCGLVGKKFCILNKQYSEQEYHDQKANIIEKMKATGEYGYFFPGHFAPNPYEESWSGFYFPLSPEEQKKFGFRTPENTERKNENCVSTDQIPDKASEVTDDLPTNIFWDEVASRPFQIQKDDITYAQKMGTILPYTYYMSRLQENFRWIRFDGTLRKSTCGKSGIQIETSWPEEYDGRILCEEEYLKLVG